MVECISDLQKTDFFPHTSLPLLSSGWTPNGFLCVRSKKKNLHPNPQRIVLSIHLQLLHFKPSRGPIGLVVFFFFQKKKQKALFRFAEGCG
jgi:hypothetical protein